MAVVESGRVGELFGVAKNWPVASSLIGVYFVTRLDSLGEAGFPCFRPNAGCAGINTLAALEDGLNVYVLPLDGSNFRVAALVAFEAAASADGTGSGHTV